MSTEANRLVNVGPRQSTLVPQSWSAKEWNRQG